MDLLNHLDFWLTIITLGAVVYFLVWKDRVQPIIRTFFPPSSDSPKEARAWPRLRRRPRPIRNEDGRFAGSQPAAVVVPVVPSGRNDVERSSEDRSASGSVVPDGNEVPVVPVSVPEIVICTMQLMQGMAPNDIAKSLPGYSGRKYREYVAKVRQVKAELDCAQALAEQRPAPAPDQRGE